jgi:carboxylesterase type B
VLVYLHGGSFVNGSASEQLYPGGPHLYEGARIASTQDVLVVTLNYRLGALGFLAGAPGVPADLGLLDQVAALRWVHDHIGAFGGDPARVTLVGESAGAMAASLHLTAMPASAGLFRAAILQSDPFGLPFRTLPQARRSADLFLLATRCKATFDTAACLRRLPLEAILAAQGSPAMRRPLLRVGLPAFLAWGPVVDGVAVTRQPLAAAFDGAVDVPVLVGTNASEGTVFFAGGGPIGYQAYRALDRVLFGREAAQRIEARLPPRVRGDNVDAVIALTTRYLFDCATDAFARAGDAPVYRYRFEAVPSFNLWTEVPRCADESCHADELAFVFGTAGGLMPFTPRERRLSDAMMPAWGSFVRDPSAPRAGGAGAPAWPDLRSSGEALVIDGARLTVAPDAPGDAQAAAPTCDFWDALGYPVGAPPQRRVPPR